VIDERGSAGRPAGVPAGRVRRMMDSVRPLMRFAEESTKRLERGEGVADFAFGNPNEMAPRAYVEALSRAVVPQRADWFAYKMSEPEATRIVASALRERFGLAFDAADVFMTNGNFTGLAVSMRAIVEPGDEVIFVSPPWFFYEVMIQDAGATPVRVLADRETWDLDLEAIERALGPRTRAIVVNSPNNPTGKIYQPATLERLASLLTAASERNRRPIYLLSDEAYNRILFDEREFHTPTAYYPRSFMLYTYAKTLLSPGSRLGYLALAPDMPEREELREAIVLLQVLGGWAFPAAVFQHALADLEGMTVDLEVLQRRRDRLGSALRELDYEIVVPEGSFYMLVRSPVEDDMSFTRTLTEHDTLVLPGVTFEMPGWIRLSLTANDEMVETGIKAFRAVTERASSPA